MGSPKIAKGLQVTRQTKAVFRILEAKPEGIFPQFCVHPDLSVQEEKSNWKTEIYPYGQTKAVRQGIQKNEAVHLALSRGESIRRVAEGLRSKENNLSRWVRKYRENSDQA
jgi:uncharacterized protein YoaH (UPF0181 family)